ncbi:MAG: hypothetical protein WD225_07175 [Ilumatobacteraceae bacterium]
MSRAEPTGPATVTPSGVAVGPEPAHAEPDGPISAMGSAGGAFLQGPEVDVEPTRAADAPIAVAVPAPPRGVVDTASATFSGSSIPGSNVCLVADAPFSARVRVTNLDNGRTLTCVASVNPAGSRHEVVLHTDAFTRIADLIEAPVPVEIAW